MKLSLLLRSKAAILAVLTMLWFPAVAQTPKQEIDRQRDAGEPREKLDDSGPDSFAELMRKAEAGSRLGFELATT